jgi:hypothetical protein
MRRGASAGSWRSRCARCVPAALAGGHRLAAKLHVSGPAGGERRVPLKAVTVHHFGSRTPPSHPGHPQDPRASDPAVADVAVSAITSLTFEQASPARLAELIRGTGRSRTGCTTSATPPGPSSPSTSSSDEPDITRTPEPLGSRGTDLGIVSKVGGHGIRCCPVQVVPGPVVAPGGARVAMAGGVLDVPERDAGVEGQGHEGMA